MHIFIRYITLAANLFRVLRKFYVLRLDRHISIASCRPRADGGRQNQSSVTTTPSKGTL